MASKSVDQFKQSCMNVTDDRRTNRQKRDHATKKCVALGKIACDAKNNFASKGTRNLS